MGANPLHAKLGLEEGDRAVILHADDIAMCHASLAAYCALVEKGLITSASVMVPCPWFPAAADYYNRHTGPELDLGIHLTFTSEWPGYRWGPVSNLDMESGIRDPDGYFYPDANSVWDGGQPAALQQEGEAQLQKARAAGIVFTHIDTHMGTVIHPKVLDIYLELATRFQVPAMLFRMDADRIRSLGITQTDAERIAQRLLELEKEDVPLLDHLHVMPLDQPEERVEQFRQVFTELPPGITCINIHPAMDSPELRAIAPDWEGRVADFNALTSEAMRRVIADSGLRVMGMRALQAVVI
jgi:predicted glycoside hydrolase/deacetylase ChbG (UPF0249 family)